MLLPSFSHTAPTTLSAMAELKGFKTAVRLTRASPAERLLVKSVRQIGNSAGDSSEAERCQQVLARLDCGRSGLRLIYRQAAFHKIQFTRITR